MTLLLYHYLLLFTALTLHIVHVKVTLKLGLPRPASEKMLGWCQGGRRHQNRLCAVPSKYATLLYGTRLLHRRLADLCIMPAISGDLLSAVISTRYILGFRKDNPNVFNMLVQNLP